MAELNSSIHSVEEAMNSESKSTAGDKHETGRAMLQLEQEKLGEQLKEMAERKKELEKIDIEITSEKVIRGSLVTTDKGIFFIGIAIGKLSVENVTVFSISPQSPLGSKLMGLKSNDRTEINGNSYLIKEIS